MCNIFKLIGLLTVGYFIFTHFVGGVLSKLYVVSVGLKLGSVATSGIPFTLPISIRNDSQTAIPIKGFEGTLLYGSTPIAPVLILSPVTISAQQVTTIDVKSQIKFSDLASDIVDLISSGQLLNNLRLVGDLFYEGISIPIDQVIKII